MNARLKTFLIALVAIVWAVNISAPLFIKDYKPSPEMNVAFMAVLGLLTAARDGGGGDNTPKPPANQNEVERDQ